MTTQKEKDEEIMAKAYLQGDTKKTIKDDEVDPIVKAYLWVIAHDIVKILNESGDQSRK